ncbi:hypothetical protein COOONC_27319 [Cooperia oncophora]
MVIVGLTGGIATGKSSVSEMLRNHGMHVIDADLVARKGNPLGERPVTTTANVKNGTIGER